MKDEELVEKISNEINEQIKYRIIGILIIIFTLFSIYISITVDGLVMLMFGIFCISIIFILLGIGLQFIIYGKQKGD